jgi:hypothetical protein
MRGINYCVNGNKMPIKFPENHKVLIDKFHNEEEMELKYIKKDIV